MNVLGVNVRNHTDGNGKGITAETEVGIDDGKKMVIFVQLIVRIGRTKRVAALTVS